MRIGGGIARIGRIGESGGLVGLKEDWEDVGLGKHFGTPGLPGIIDGIPRGLIFGAWGLPKSIIDAKKPEPQGLRI